MCLIHHCVPGTLYRTWHIVSDYLILNVCECIIYRHYKLVIWGVDLIIIWVLSPKSCTVCNKQIFVKVWANLSPLHLCYCPFLSSYLHYLTPELMQQPPNCSFCFQSLPVSNPSSISLLMLLENPSLITPKNCKKNKNNASLQFLSMSFSLIPDALFIFIFFPSCARLCSYWFGRHSPNTPEIIMPLCFH